MEETLNLSSLKLIELAELRQEYIDEYVSNDTNKDRDSVKKMLDVVELISSEMSTRDWESELDLDIKEESGNDRIKNLLIVVCVYALLAASAMFFFMSKVDYATFFLLTHYLAGSFASNKLS